jgi:hypothetical protein
MNPCLASIYDNYRLMNCKISQPNQYKEQEATTENRPLAIEVARLFLEIICFLTHLIPQIRLSLKLMTGEPSI